MDSKMNDPAFAGQSPESHLKRQSLECLVAILRSLVSWSARGNPLPASMSTSTISHMNRSDSISLPAVPGGFSAEDVDLTLGSTSSLPYSPGSGAATPDATDAPSRFENARQKKTTLLEGIKKFNFKPKRVSHTMVMYHCPAGTLTDSDMTVRVSDFSSIRVSLLQKSPRRLLSSS